MRTSGPALGVLMTTAFLLAACDGSSSPHPSQQPPAPVAISTCAASIDIPTDSARAVPSGSVPPTVVIPTGDALSLDVPSGSTLGLGAPVGRGDGAVLCRAPGSVDGTTELIGQQPGFVRVVVMTGSGRQLGVNVQVTV